MPSGGVTQIAAGSCHFLAIGSDVHAYAWGCNAYGQLGDWSYASRAAPVRVLWPLAPEPTSGALTGVAQVAGGGSFSVFLGVDYAVYTCGANDHGQLGDGTLTTRNYPVRVVWGNNGWPAAPATGITQVAAGLNHAVVLGADAQVYSWGSDNFGEQGIGAPDVTYSYVAPHLVAWGADLEPAYGIAGITAGFGFTAVLSVDNHVYSWGNGQFGVLCDGAQTLRSYPASSASVPVTMQLGSHSPNTYHFTALQVATSFSATPSPSPACSSLILNANFEAGISSWEPKEQIDQLGIVNGQFEPTTGSFSFRTATAIAAPFSGTMYALADPKPGTSQVLRQSFVVPGGVTSISIDVDVFCEYLNLGIFTSDSTTTMDFNVATNHQCRVDLFDDSLLYDLWDPLSYGPPYAMIYSTVLPTQAGPTAFERASNVVSVTPGGTYTIAARVVNSIDDTSVVMVMGIDNVQICAAVSTSPSPTPSISQTPSRTPDAVGGGRCDLVSAVELPILANGGFERGDTSGWRNVDWNSDYEGSFFHTAGFVSPLSQNILMGPIDGRYYAVADQRSPQSSVLYQDFTIPVGVSHIIVTAYTFCESRQPVVTAATMDLSVTPNQHCRVDVMDPDVSPPPFFDPNSNAGVIASVVPPGGTYDTVEGPWQFVYHEMDVTPGQTYRLAFRNVNTRDFINQGVDQVAICSRASAVTPGISPSTTNSAISQSSTNTASRSLSFSSTAHASHSRSESQSTTRTSTETATASETGTASTTHTRTASTTRTKSNSGTPSNTPSISDTPSRGSSLTSTSTMTATASTTISATPSLSTTRSASATRTPSRSTTSTASMTASNTRSASSSSTNSATSSPSLSASNTPTNGPTPSRTRTPAPTRTVTTTFRPRLGLAAPPPGLSTLALRTSTKSRSLTPSSTETASRSVGASISFTRSSTRTRSWTRSLTATKSTTETASATRSASESNSITATASLSFGASPSITRTPTASLSVGASPSNTNTATASLSFGASPSNTNTISATPSPSNGTLVAVVAIADGAGIKFSDAQWAGIIVGAVLGACLLCLLLLCLIWRCCCKRKRKTQSDSKEIFRDPVVAKSPRKDTSDLDSEGAPEGIPSNQRVLTSSVHESAASTSTGTGESEEPPQPAFLLMSKGSVRDDPEDAPGFVAYPPSDSDGCASGGSAVVLEDNTPIKKRWGRGQDTFVLEEFSQDEEDEDSDLDWDESRETRVTTVHHVVPTTKMVPVTKEVLTETTVQAWQETTVGAHDILSPVAGINQTTGEISVVPKHSKRVDTVMEPVLETRLDTLGTTTMVPTIQPSIVTQQHVRRHVNGGTRTRRRAHLDDMSETEEFWAFRPGDISDSETRNGDDRGGEREDTLRREFPTAFTVDARRMSRDPFWDEEDGPGFWVKRDTSDGESSSDGGLLDETEGTSTPAPRKGKKSSATKSKTKTAKTSTKDSTKNSSKKSSSKLSSKKSSSKLSSSKKSSSKLSSNKSSSKLSTKNSSNKEDTSVDPSTQDTSKATLKEISTKMSKKSTKEESSKLSTKKASTKKAASTKNASEAKASKSPAKTKVDAKASKDAKAPRPGAKKPSGKTPGKKPSAKAGKK